MTLNELKAAILENGTGIYFEFNGKKCGVEPRETAPFCHFSISLA